MGPNQPSVVAPFTPAPDASNGTPAPLIAPVSVSLPSAPSVQQPQATVVQPPAQVVPIEEHRSAIESARTQEKNKLYGDIEAVKNRAKAAEDELTRLRATMQPDDRTAADLQAMRVQNETLTQQLNVLTTQVQQLADGWNHEISARRVAELNSYMVGRIGAYKDANVGIVLEMVGGDSEQAIEASLQRAAQAYQNYFGTVVPQAPVAISVQAAPNGFPTPPNAASPPTVGAGLPGFGDEVARLTSEEAIRSGAYAQNRGAIHQMLSQMGGTGLPGPMSNMPRQLPGVMPQHAYANVSVPQGLPTPQVINPHMPQMRPQQPMVPPAYQPPVPMQQPMAPPSTAPGGFDAAAARQHAASVAQGHLTNPQSAHAAVTSNAPTAHGEYGKVPNQAANFGAVISHGAHPMIRTS